MTLSRTHMSMLAAVSIFTGIIAPAVGNASGTFPFPLTNMQIVAYILLILIGIVFLVSAMRNWKWLRLVWVIAIIIIIYLGFMAWTGQVTTSTGTILSSFTWGWFFLLIGCLLLIVSMFRPDTIENKTAQVFDAVVGWIGAMTILWLTVLIIFISFSRSGGYTKSVLQNAFWTGSVETRTGITLSPAYGSIEKLSFDRSKDMISFFTASGSDMVAIPEMRVFDRLPYAKTNISGNAYYIAADGTTTDQSGTLLWKAILPQDINDGLIYIKSGILHELRTSGEDTIIKSVTDTFEELSTTSDGKSHIWKSKTESGYTLYRDGVVVAWPLYGISHISANRDGSSIMSLARDAEWSGAYILKNNIKTIMLEKGYISGTLRMNGSDSIYAIEQDGVIKLIYNGSIIDKKFDEVREIFLEENGTGYAYFWRPLGENTYCLYTRYKGNLCGLTGYMNPRKSADGSSIIYAAIKDGAWGIYRNISPVIKNTGYPNTSSIARDYAFFDTTNPNYYLFISYSNDGYRLYKKWKWIDWIWKDVGLDVLFGYNNKVIMSVQDDTGWRVIEI